MVDAFYKMETLEMFSQSLLLAKMFGEINYLSNEQVEKVNRLLQGEEPDKVAGLN